MGGWDTTGKRVVTSTTETKEYRNLLELNGGVFTWTEQYRTIKQERAETRALTKSGAENLTATSGWTIISRDRKDDSAQYVVVEEKITTGEWTDVE
jgi:hypothetical protein